MNWDFMLRPRQMGETTGRPARRRARRAAGVMASLGVHLFVLAALIGFWSPPPRPVEAPPIEVSLVKMPKPVPPAPPAPVKAPAAPKAAAQKAAKSPRPAKTARAPAKAQLRVAVHKTAPAKVPAISAGADLGPPELTEAALAGAAGAGSGSGSGSGGGDCDMIRRVQAALRKDVLVRTEVASAGNGARAMLVWNGDWVQGHGEDGKGLAAVREAIIWEVGFAPKACRTEPVRGLVIFTLGEGVGAPRLVVGQHAWRWSDMLGVR
jgi:hypothetical protein